jgi:protein-S-isoprenylcysteine O-methyltransferase Ste14
MAVFAVISLAVLTPLLSIDILVVRATAVFRRDDPTADRLLLAVAAVPLVAWYLLIPVDVFHLELLPKPPLSAAAVGLTLVVAGMVIAVWAESANPFAAPAITHLKERDHRVIDVGPYRFVRHPMYAGGACIFIGVPVWLESTAAALLAVLPILILVQRIRIEERFLQAHLDGYPAFMQRVRYRLIPHLW